MMNSMNNTELGNALSQTFGILNVEELNKHQIAVDVKNNEVHAILSHLKSNGWKQLSLLTCVDWIQENEFQLVYIVFNWDNPIWVQVRTRIERENPAFQTVQTIYAGAKYYEREVHEFFGVVFDGNPDCVKQLFLENWDDIPPLRKDFDSRAYSDKKYRKRTYETNFVNKEDK